MKKFISVASLFLFMIAPAWGATPGYDESTGQIILPSEYQEGLMRQQQSDLAEIEAAEQRYVQQQQEEEERQKILLWENLDTEIKLRRYDQMVMGMKKEFDEARHATNPFLGEQGYVIYPYGEVVPIITCRPMRMTDIALEPGESIMGIHAGDTVRWQFSPSQSMKNNLPVAHIVVKPNQPGISTNLLVHTDRRTYNLDFTSSESLEYIRGVAFSYQISDLTSTFASSQAAAKRQTGKLEDDLQREGMTASLDDLYTRYTITNKSKVDWCPETVFDDGNKTYIKMPPRFSETPAFYIVLDRRDTLTNYRVKGRYYIVDRLFDKAYMRIGTKRVVITRREKLAVSNQKASDYIISGGNR